MPTLFGARCETRCYLNLKIVRSQPHKVPVAIVEDFDD